MAERITGQTDRQTDRSRFFISKDSGKAIVGRVSIDCDRIQKLIYFSQSHQLLLSFSTFGDALKFWFFVTLKTCFIVHMWTC